MRASSAVRLFFLLAALTPMAGAQQVHVYSENPKEQGTTPRDSVTQDGLDQPILVIPVVTSETPLTPANSQLDAATLLNLNARFSDVSKFWLENSYGVSSFQANIQSRVYQLPRDRSYYFNPAYIEPVTIGTTIPGPTVTVPAGTLHLDLKISDSDKTAIDIVFTAGESPFTLENLGKKICDNLGVGDKVVCSLVNDGPDVRHLRLAVAQSYAGEGSFVHLDRTKSHAGVLTALGLDLPVSNLASPSIDSRPVRFPLGVPANSTLTVRLENGTGTPEDFIWNFPNDITFNTLADLLANIGTANGKAAVTAVGNSLHFDLTPSMAGPFASIEVLGPLEVVAALGFLVESTGVVSVPASMTVRGDWNGIAAQAIAAMLIDELTRPPGPGPDLFPNMDINAANKADIDQLVSTLIDNHRAVVVLFRDAPKDQRAGAAGGFLNIGIDSGTYLYQYQMFANMQIMYDDTTEAVLAHEFGHNLWFWDLYNNSNDYLLAYRYANDWDVMSNHELMPHTDIYNKEIVNQWVTKMGATMDRFPEPKVTGVPVLQQYVLTPLEFSWGDYDSQLTGVPPGRTVVKGIQLLLGVEPVNDTHYLLVSNRQKGALFSSALPQKLLAPAAGGVYITDAISTPTMSTILSLPTTRNLVHPITDVQLGPRSTVVPVLDNAPGPDIDILKTFPAYDGITVDIVGQIAGPGALADRPSYLVDVTREQKGFLDLAITPWGAPPYESPDIWLEHPDLPLSEKPLKGNGDKVRWATNWDPKNGPMNYIRVQVSNNGTVEATKVKVRVKVSNPPGIGDTGDWVILPSSDPQDIPAGSSRIFSLPWSPTVDQHTCLLAEVLSWESTLGESNPWNQRAQENVTDFFPTSSSPWGDTPFEFDVANKRSVPITAYVTSKDLPPGYLVSFDPQTMIIPAESTVRVKSVLSLDSTIIPPVTPQNPRPPDPGIFHVVGAERAGDFELPLGGITYRVFPDMSVDADVTVWVDGSGNVVVDGTTHPASSGDTIEVLVCYESGKCEWIVTTTDGSGNIHEVIPPKEDGHVNVTVYPPSNYHEGPVREVVDPAHPGSGPGGAGGSYEFGFFLGGFFPSHETQLLSGLDTGFRFAKFFHPKWSAEVEGGIVFTHRAGDDGLLGHAQAQVLWHAGLATQPVRPFLLLGLGVASFQTATYGETAPALVLGAGADFRWKPNVGFRVDAVDFVMHDLFGTGTVHDFQVLWGVTFRF